MDEHMADELAELDPTRVDPAPLRGSARYQTILETAMTRVDSQPRTDNTRATALYPQPTTALIQRRRTRLAAAAAAALVVAVSVVSLLPSGAPPAEATVHRAAEALGAVESLRATLRQEYPNGEVWTFHGEFRGTDGHQQGIQQSADGTRMAVWDTVVIGDTMWTVSDGHVAVDRLGPEERLAPFAHASAAVVSAALEGGDVREIGREDLNGDGAVRYRIVPDDTSRAALGRLAPGQLSWFSLEDPAAVAHIDVWVFDENIHRIDIDFVGGFFMLRTTNRFFDFDADIFIQPPA